MTTVFAKDGAPSVLPPIRELAARVRDGEDLHDIATQYGFAYSSLTSRFSQAGFAVTGETLSETKLRRMRAQVEATPPWWEEWMGGAVCAQTDPEAFFPEKGGSTREAKKVCLDCSVRNDCLQYALNNNERFGIWGGKSERERRKLAGKAHPCEVAA